MNFSFRSPLWPVGLPICLRHVSRSESGVKIWRGAPVPQDNVSGVADNAADDAHDNAMKILHADDHALFREGIRFFLKLLDTQVTALEAGTLQATVDKLALEWPIDLLLLDLEMPGMNGGEGFFALRRRYPQLRIAVLSGLADANVIRPLIEGGARGFIPKLAGSEQLLDALRRILSGEVYVPDAMFLRPAAPGGELLTARQLEILPLLAEGLGNKAIASTLGVTEGTVKQHLKDLFKRLGARNRTQAVQEARRQGLVEK